MQAVAKFNDWRRSNRSGRISTSVPGKSLRSAKPSVKPPGDLETLTAREIATFRLMVDEKPSKEIAVELRDQHQSWALPFKKQRRWQLPDGTVPEGEAKPEAELQF